MKTSGQKNKNLRLRQGLLIDDEPDICEILQMNLDDLGVEWTTAANGAEALALVRARKTSNPFDVILSDFSMPKLNGLEFLKSLREMGNQTPVIWMTAYHTTELFREAWRYGVFEVLEKPMNLEQLHEVLITALQLKNGADPLPRPAAAALARIEVKIDLELFTQFQDQCVARGTSASTCVTEFIVNQLKNESSKKKVA